ncbi:hypothetical protein MRX96_039409 [Rhipicephalus microplus]
MQILEGYAWTKNRTEHEEVLTRLFGNMMRRKFPLRDVYFTIREEGAPSDSTLYRFNFTNGKIWNMDHLLNIKRDPKVVTSPPC